jgi:hypothetical protein
MKPLILILLASVCAQAQTIADAARRERARQAQVRTTKIYTTEDIKGIGANVPTQPVENPAPGGAAAPASNPPATPTATVTVDPLEQWTQETAKLRTQVRDLLDQETAIQLEINAATAQINAPITTQSAKDQAARLQQSGQERLITLRAELARLRAELAEKDLQGPPVRRPQQD